MQSAKTRSLANTIPSFSKSGPFLKTAALYAWIFLSIVKVPATAVKDSPRQSWQAVLAYAADHSLQWGRDVVFTYGPLGFLSSEFYWGSFLLPMVLWSFAFAGLLSFYILRLLPRSPLLLRIPFVLALPLLTTPSLLNLSVDPLAYLFITIGAVVCFPSEKPPKALVGATSAAFAVIALIKFTFFIYCGFALCVVSAAYAIERKPKWAVLVPVVFATVGAALCAMLHQRPASLLLYVLRSMQVAGGYSKAMMLPVQTQDLQIGIALLVLLIVVAVLHLLGERNWPALTGRMLIISASVFLAWKEGLVRADDHVAVFLLYAFFLTPLLPSLLRGGPPAEDDKPALWRDVSAKLPQLRVVIPPRTLLLLSVSVLLLAVAPFFTYRQDFRRAMLASFKGRYSDTALAAFNPRRYAQDIRHQFNEWREQSTIPEFKALIGNSTVDVLALDQPIAILSGLRYTPHPVFQSYSAYTPALHALNETFFNSAAAPEFLIWRFNTIDSRFPTLDEGTALLPILANYRPIGCSGAFTLWKRSSERCAVHAPQLSKTNKVTDSEWFAIPSGPVWFRVDLQPSLLGAFQGLLASSSAAVIEVELKSGLRLHYRLPPGCARSGFLLSPLLQTDANLRDLDGADPVLRARILTDHPACFRSAMTCSIGSLQAPGQSRNHQGTSTLASSMPLK